MKLKTKKYFVIYCENKKKYWDRIYNKFRPLEFATHYEGGSIDQIYLIIENEINIKHGSYSVKRILEKIKTD